MHWPGALAVLAAAACCQIAQAQEASNKPIEYGRKVNIPPLIVDEPPKIIYFREEYSIKLPCVATGFPEPIYSWNMDDRAYDPSGNDGRVAIQPGEGTLIFARPLRRDEGFYQCNATNEVGTAISIRTFLRRAYLDDFPQYQSDRTMQSSVGDPLQMKCVPPTSIPDPYVYWGIDDGMRIRTIDESDRVTVDPLGNLNFANVEKSDEANNAAYKCIVQNYVTQAITQGQVIRLRTYGQSVRYNSPKEVWHTPNQKVALRGSKANMMCIFSGSPTPTVSWRRVSPAGQSLPDMHRYEKYGQELIIEQLKYEDAGIYECKGQNVEGPIPITRSVTLTVQSAPQWIKFPTSIDAAIGGNAEFHCQGDGIPYPNHDWFINGVVITQNAQHKYKNRIVETNKILFKDITTVDVQVIQCNVSNKHDYIFKNAYLNVLREPATIQDPPIKDQKAAEGATVNLTCRVFGSPKPQIVWKKGSEQLTGGRYKIYDNGFMQINDVSLVDAGDYTCTASNEYATVSAPGNLVVRRRTLIQTKPEDIMVEKGSEAKFTCTATTDPAEVQNLKITWEKDQYYLDTNTAQRMYQNLMDNSLTVSGAQWGDNGRYTCVACNGVDCSKAGAQLIVQEPPDPPQMIQVKCTNHKRMAEITWMPGREHYAPILYYKLQYNTTFTPDVWYDILPQQEERKPNSTLPRTDPLPGFLPNTTRYDYTMSPWGNYTFRLLARNKVGFSQPSHHTTQVCTTEASVPFKNPEYVIAEGDKPNNLVIFWTPMIKVDHNGPDFKYIVSWAPADNEANVKSVTIGRPDSWHYVVQDRISEPFQKFLVKVKSHNSYGPCRVDPDWVVGYSGEGEPDVAPNDLYVEPDSVTDTQAVLVWSHVDTSPRSLKGFFRGYRIQYGKQSEWPETVREEDVIIDPSRNQYPRPRWKRDLQPEHFNRSGNVIVRLRHLPPNSDVYVQVRVLNKYWIGPPSTRLDFRTLEGRPGPPKHFDIIATGSTYLQLKWEKPQEPNGVLTGYRVSYQIVSGLNFGGLTERALIQDPNEMSLRLTGLKPDTYYRVFVAAKTSAAEGEVIFFDTKTQPAGIPGTPTFAITDYSNRSFTVEWEPSRGGSPGSVFYVEYRMRGNYQWWRTPPTYLSRELKVQPIDSGTTYQVRTVATNGVGGEKASEWLEVHTSGVQSGVFNLSRSVWFYGIFIAIILIVMVVVLFIVAKRITDRWHKAKEDAIDEQTRQFQAEAAAEELGILHQGSREYLYESQATIPTMPLHATGPTLDRSYEVADDYGPELFDKQPINREVEYPQAPVPEGEQYAQAYPTYGHQVAYAPAPVHVSYSRAPQDDVFDETEEDAAHASGYGYAQQGKKPSDTFV